MGKSQKTAPEGLLQIIPLDQIGKFFRKARRNIKGMGQTEVAKRTDYCITHISQMENGKKMDTDEIAKFADAYGMKVCFVVGMNENDIRRLLDAQD